MISSTTVTSGSVARQRSRAARAARGGPEGENMPVRRADFLTDVAAEDPVADRGPQFHRECAAMLDREVRDAAWRVEDVRRRDGVRRAGGHAGRARAARLPQRR